MVPGCVADSYTASGTIYKEVLCKTSIKNNCLKLKNEVGMAVLKNKQTRVVYMYPFRSQTVANLQPYCMDRKLAK